jgi:hypothetical protein
MVNQRVKEVNVCEGERALPHLLNMATAQDMHSENYSPLRSAALHRSQIRRSTDKQPTWPSGMGDEPASLPRPLG